VFIATACGGEKGPAAPSSPPGAPSGTGSTLSALIDGVVWNQPNVIARYSQTNNRYLEVDSIDTGNNLFGFAFGKFGTNNGDLTPGTYEIGPTNTNANFVTAGGTAIWSATPAAGPIAGKGSGRVVLTSFSTTAKTASGTFSFVLVNANSTKTVTNGVFNVRF
jgi:hypothetical protein